MSPSLFITATDTGVGKTFVGCLLAEAIREAGMSVGVLKPFSAGDLDDATLLHRASGETGDPRSATLLYLPLPLTPAAQVGLGDPGQKRIETVFAQSVATVENIQKKRDCVLVEGVGGVLAPLGGRLVVADLITRLGLPVWIVARAGLGTLNHTLLTVEALQHRGLMPRRIILNNFKGKELSERSNGRILKRLTGIPVTEIPCTSTRARENKAKRLIWASFKFDFLI